MEQSRPREDYEGTLRLRATILAIDRLKIEWYRVIDRNVIEVLWTEEIAFPRQDYAAVSLIECTGTFQAHKNSHFFDSDGLRHFHMRAEPGLLEGLLGQPTMKS